LNTSLHAELVAHWPLDSDGSDVVGGFNGAVHESISFDGIGANANTGGSATFAGAGGIQAAHDAALNPSSFTLTAWVNPTDTAGWNSVITSREDNGTSVNGYILYNTPENQWDFWTGGGGGPGAWGRNIGPDGVLNEWTHLAITYDEGTDTKTLFVNGESAAEVAGQGYVPNGTTPENARPFNIGAGEDFGTNFFFNGRIDDVGLFNNVLSGAQIQSVMANGVASVPEPTSVVLLLIGALGLISRARRRN
jgi:hypothetical protein